MLEDRLKKRLRGKLPPSASYQRRFGFPKGPKTHSSLGFNLWLKSRLQDSSTKDLRSFDRLGLACLTEAHDATRLLLNAQHKLSLVGISAENLLRKFLGQFSLLAKLKVEYMKPTLGVYFMALSRQPMVDKKGSKYWEPP